MHFDLFLVEWARTGSEDGWNYEAGRLSTEFSTIVDNFCIGANRALVGVFILSSQREHEPPAHLLFRYKGQVMLFERVVPVRNRSIFWGNIIGEARVRNLLAQETLRNACIDKFRRVV